VKAAVCRAFGAPLEIEELRLAPPEREEVRVKVAACAVCHSDVHFAEGAWGGELPAVAGHEAAGVVEEIGPGVPGVRPGDRVVVSLLRSCGRCFFCTRGESHLCEAVLPIDRDVRLRTPDGEPVHQAMRTAAFAEEVVVHESQLAVIPPSLGFDVASLIGCGVLTGLGAVTERAGVKEGASVVVVGTGGVGLNAVQGAVIAGAREIVGIDVSPGKREAALRFGATHAMDPRAGDPREQLRALTGGRGADYVLVTVGSTEAIEQGLSWLRRGGTLVVVGMPPAGEKIGVVAVDLAHDDIRLLGSKMGSARLAEAVPQIVELYEQGRLRLDELVSARYPLERINEAIAASGDGSALRNVIVFEAA
jgi:S-(hydroxymethyl)glutathione dehydrogenase / alcohol dehydrogenase